MAAARAPALYSPKLLALAVELADYPYDPAAIACGTARSRSCGSVIDLSSSQGDRLETIGLKVTACAVGQASAAIFAREARGMGGEGANGIVMATTPTVDAKVEPTPLSDEVL